MINAVDNRLYGLINRLAGVVAILITVVPPFGFLLTEYQELHGSLDADSRTQAVLVSQIIARNPGIWQLAHERLNGSLLEVRDPARRTRILDVKGNLVSEIAAPVRSPVMEREAEIFDYGTSAGVVRVAASLHGVLLNFAFVLAGSGAVGFIVFFPLRRIPAAALRNANHALLESERRNSTVVNGLREGVVLADERLFVLAANPGASRILGVPQMDLVGANLAAIFDGVAVGREGAPLEQAQWPVSLAFSTGQPQEDFDFGVRHPGAPVTWLKVNAQAVASGDGNSRFVVMSFEDQTETIVAEERLMLTHQAFQSTADAIFIADACDGLVYVNRAFTTITGFAPEESIGHSFRQLACGGLDGGHVAEMMESVKKDGAWRGDFWSRRKDGQPFAAWLNICMVRDDAGRSTHLVGVFSDITERLGAEEHIRNLAHHDTLTGLPNRAMLRESMTRILASARRRGGEVGVLFIDLDHFKVVNDTMGHAVGDQVLIEVGRRLAVGVREEDLVARLAGDEFVVVLPGLSGPGDAANVADKILKEICVPFDREGREFLLTPSIGISMFPADGDKVDDLLTNSDTAMYCAKGNGRANFQFFSSTMNRATSSRLEVANEVRNGLTRNEFVLYYQPQIEAQSGRLCGVEALIRWNHPARGLVAPGAFIPLVEGSRLIIDVGEWVLREASRQAREWRSRGLDAVPIAVNISALHFQQDNFVAQASACFAAQDFPPGSIEIEITESLMIDNPDATLLKMHTLKDMGFALSLDDFGTGYSSLGYLTRYPFDKLKIDQTFVRRITHDPTTVAIVEAIISLAHAVHLDVLAEGVETTAEAALLKRKGCDQFQGYLLAKPMPADQFEAWLHGDRAAVGLAVNA